MAQARSNLLSPEALTLAQMIALLIEFLRSTGSGGKE